MVSEVGLFYSLIHNISENINRDRGRHLIYLIVNKTFGSF